MSEPRSAKLRRLVRVQRQIERMAEFDLADTARERSRLTEQIEGCVTALESLAPEHRLFANLYGERIGTLTVRDTRLAGLQAVQEQKLLTERAKADRLSDAAKTARGSEERENEEAGLYELIDRIASGAPPASRKLDER